MAKKKPQEEAGGLPEWMGTYGDLVTLLLCFFVLLFAMSSVDESKYTSVAESFNSNITFIKGGGATGVNNMLGSGINNLPKVDRSVNDSKSKREQDEQKELNKMASDFKTYFAEQNVQENVTVEVTDDYVKITFGDGILFDSGSAELKNSSKEVLDLIATELEAYPESSLKFEGYTDDVPIHSAIFPDNMYLSAARSISVLNYFKDVHKISPELLSQEGFGQYKPIAPNDTPEGRAKNRRVEIKITSQFNESNDKFDQYSNTASTTNDNANADSNSQTQDKDINEIVTEQIIPKP